MLKPGDRVIHGASAGKVRGRIRTIEAVVEVDGREGRHHTSTYDVRNLLPEEAEWRGAIPTWGALIDLERQNKEILLELGHARAVLHDLLEEKGLTRHQHAVDRIIAAARVAASMRLDRTLGDQLKEFQELVAALRELDAAAGGEMAPSSAEHEAARWPCGNCGVRARDHELKHRFVAMDLPDGWRWLELGEDVQGEDVICDPRGNPVRVQHGSWSMTEHNHPVRTRRP